MTFSTQRFFGIGVVALGLLGSVFVSNAAPPSGFVSLSFSSNSLPVYDLSGSLQFDQTMIGLGETDIPLSYGINLTQDTHGLIVGSGITEVAAGDNFVAAEYTARGRVSVRQGVTHVTLVVRLRGNDAFGGITTPFSITISYSLDVSPESGTLEGTARGSANFGKFGRTRIRTEVSVPFSGAADGSWLLQMNVVAFNRLGGSATITLPNSRVLTFNVTGGYSAALDRSTLRLVGTGDSRGNNAVLVFSDQEVTSVRGRLFGQTIILQPSPD